MYGDRYIDTLPAGCIHKGRNLGGTNLSQAPIRPLYALEWSPFPTEATALEGGGGGPVDILASNYLTDN